MENVLSAINNILLTNWGSQNYCQVIAITDCGIGLGVTSLKNTILNIQMAKTKQQTGQPTEPPILPFAYPSKLNMLCLGNLTDIYFKKAYAMYQQLLDVSGQKGQLFLPKPVEEKKEDGDKPDFNSPEPTTSSGTMFSRHALNDMVDEMCDSNYKQFEAILKCGSYYKLECPIMIWPPPLPYISKESETDRVRLISKKIEITGYISLSEIGSPMSVSRHLILPKSIDTPLEKQQSSSHNKSTERGSKTPTKVEPSTSSTLTTDFDKLEVEIKNLYAKNEGYNSDDEATPQPTVNDSSSKESVCVLLHGALKVENMAALCLLNDDWFGFIYSYADSKKKSNLMLTVLPPGNNIIPWLGDLRYLGTIDDAFPGENPAFPVKPEKRSYSQNCVVWIRHTGLQSDIQKVLRHAKKLPEKTQHFYKELNRIRRAALSLGFVELLEGLSNIFEREVSGLSNSVSPDCEIQLKHAAKELRKLTNRDLKTSITAWPTKYNQLS